MKKFLLATFLMVISLCTYANVKDDAKANIKFEKTTHDFGSFSESDGQQTCTFKFTNNGKGTLVIHQAISSCGCTVPKFPKHPIKPGEGGEITVTYNGAGRFPGHFKKSVAIRTNGVRELVRLYIQGDMTPKR